MEVCSMEYDYEYFKKEILKLTQIDLNAYKERQMKRRIDTLIGKNKIVGYDKYVDALKSNKDIFWRLLWLLMRFRLNTRYILLSTSFLRHVNF